MSGKFDPAHVAAAAREALADPGGVSLQSVEIPDYAQLKPLAIRRRLGRAQWAAPQPYGLGGWLFEPLQEHDPRILASVHPETPDEWWIHASIFRRGRMPDYEDLKLLHAAVFGRRWAYQVFAPPADHINLSPYVLHLWGRADGLPSLPNFGQYGTI